MAAARAALFVATLALPHAGGAQIRASEAAVVSQTIDGTVVTLEYSRPRLRGRTGLFGSRAVHWGETWTPGANWATTLDINRDITIDGQAVTKGKYSMWMIVRAQGDWTLLLDPRAKRFHMNPPDSMAGQFRIPIRPEHAPTTEVLTWSFPEVRTNGALLAMQWDTVRIALDVRVAPSLSITTPEAEARAYLGTYELVKQDTSSHHTQLVVIYDNGTLKADFIPAEPYFKRFALIRVGPETFVPGLYDKTGEIYEVLRTDATFTFTRSPGKPVSVEARGEDDSLWWSGVRRSQ